MAGKWLKFKMKACASFLLEPCILLENQGHKHKRLCVRQCACIVTAYST